MRLIKVLLGVGRYLDQAHLCFVICSSGALMLPTMLTRKSHMDVTSLSPTGQASLALDHTTPVPCR